MNILPRAAQTASLLMLVLKLPASNSRNTFYCLFWLLDVYSSRLVLWLYIVVTIFMPYNDAAKWGSLYLLWCMFLWAKFNIQLYMVIYCSLYLAGCCCISGLLAGNKSAVLTGLRSHCTLVRLWVCLRHHDATVCVEQKLIVLHA